MKTARLSLDMASRRYADLTDAARRFVAGERDGLLNVFVPHATAAVAVIELGDGSEHDLEAALERLLPRDDALYRHRHGSPGHGADHLVPAFLAPSVTVPVLGGSPALGVWQRIVLVDTNRDNPRRDVLLSFLEGS
ncbi:MAG TPA: YjbQ family protein [Dehalococcoidia bacterium]|nr:YjbQ family protein [Dehalococcoidia bacterium]